MDNVHKNNLYHTCNKLLLPILKNVPTKYLPTFPVVFGTRKNDLFFVFSFQLMVAKIWTLFYILEQAVVLIGIIIKMKMEGICSPVFIFFSLVAGIFLFAAILHPQVI